MTMNEMLDFLAAHPELKLLDGEVIGVAADGIEVLLGRIKNRKRSGISVVLSDCPPNFGKLVSNMLTFDATVNFDCELDGELRRALRDVAPGTPLTVIIFADGEDCEVGRIYVGDETLPELSEDDWRVTGTNIEEIVDKLIALV